MANYSAIAISEAQRRHAMQLPVNPMVLVLPPAEQGTAPKLLLHVMDSLQPPLEDMPLSLPGTPSRTAIQLPMTGGAHALMLIHPDNAIPGQRHAFHQPPNFVIMLTYP